jgi:hypothetical protein
MRRYESNSSRFALGLSFAVLREISLAVCTRSRRSERVRAQRRNSETADLIEAKRVSESVRQGTNASATGTEGLSDTRITH